MINDGINIHIQEPKHDKFVHYAPFSCNDSNNSQMDDDDWGDELSCLHTHLENTNNDELEIESFSNNVQGPEEHITNETFVDDASFCEWIDISRTDELASKDDELENFRMFPSCIRRTL
jgi:hypothetical protein